MSESGERIMSGSGRDRGRGRVALVTGGGSGIGEACAAVLAGDGWRVVVADRNAEAAAAVAAHIGGTALAFDVANAIETEAAAQECEAAIGPVAALVACAGVLQPPLPPEDLDLAAFDQVMAVNLRGTYLSCTAFGARMARRGSGAIVAIASITASRAVPLHAYAPSKAAVVHMSACLAAEWARSGVRVNAVSPGFVATPPLQAAIDRGQRDPGALAGAAAMGRLVKAEEVARAAAFLLSDEASAITGIDLPVDAGWLVGAHLGTYGGPRPPRQG